MANYAQIETREAWLWTDFGFDFASRIFPQDILDNLPRYVRGEKKGKIKNHKIVWEKVESGGWVGLSRASNNGVENRVGKVINARLVCSPFREEEQIVLDYERDAEGKWRVI